jgi:hypothetical protein
VNAFLSAADVTEHFHLPLSEQGHQEYLELKEIVQNIQEKKIMTSGIICGDRRTTLQSAFTATYTKTSNLQVPFSGFGNQDAATN